MTGRGGRRLLVLALALLIAGCRTTAEIALRVTEDGSGTVEVGVGLDDAAVEATGDPSALLRVEDLEEAGWDVGAPVLEDDGLTWTRVTKPFGNPREAVSVLAEVTGPDGALRDVDVAVEDGFARTTYRFAGTLDLTGGLEQFSDAELAQALDGEPLGASVDDIEEEYGISVEDAFVLRFLTDLPGDVDASWESSLDDDQPTEMELSSDVVERSPLVWSGVAAVAALVALVLLVTGLVARRRRRRDPGAPDVPGEAVTDPA